MTSRRGFIFGLGATLIAAPAIVRAGSLMPVKLINWEIPYGIAPHMTLQEFARLLEMRGHFDRMYEEVAELFVQKNSILDELPYG